MACINAQILSGYETPKSSNALNIRDNFERNKSQNIWRLSILSIGSDAISTDSWIPSNKINKNISRQWKVNKSNICMIQEGNSRVWDAKEGNVVREWGWVVEWVWDEVMRSSDVCFPRHRTVNSIQSSNYDCNAIKAIEAVRSLEIEYFVEFWGFFSNFWSSLWGQSCAWWDFHHRGI